jgi:hypothetical protein
MAAAFLQKLIALILIFLSAVYAKFFLARTCKQELKSFEQALKKIKAKPKTISLALFALLNTILIFLYEGPLASFLFSLFFIALLVVYKKDKKIFLLLLLLYFFLSQLFFQHNFFALIAIVFSLIYFSFALASV